MKKINIEITKAVLESFSVELKDGKPEVNATIALLTPHNKKITTYTVYTDEWHSDKIELPLEAMPLIGELARILEGVVVRHCREGQKALAPPSRKQTAVTKNFHNIPDGTKVTITNVGDEPINLDDIPF